MTSHAVLTVHCPSCSTSYPVDSGKVPAGGVRARCGNCSGVFLVEPRGQPDRRADAASRQAARQSPPPRRARLGTVDPADRAARLARVLVSDMISYNSDRHERALAAGTLREEFADEVRRSWSEYVRRVGRDLAQGSRYFQDELNATLARGEKLY